MMAKGIRERHARSCRSHKGGRCSCTPSFEAQVWNPAERRPARKTFHDINEAGAWVRDARTAIRRGRAVRKPSPTLEDASTAWLQRARAGVIRATGGHPYKPATIREYECALRRRANPALGTEPLDAIARADLQVFVDELAAEGLAATTIETTINAIRAIYRHELARDRVKGNPTRGVALPSGGNRRERFATPTEAKALLAALPQEDRAVFGATAVSPFCRRGLQRRADAAWKAAGLERITLHECRHTFASIAIAAGVNIGTVSAALGHASVTITWDRYHHLMPGTMNEAASLIQAYVESG